MNPELPQHLSANIANFTGRTWLLPVLLAWLEQTDERMFILTGEPGAGKSSVMAWLAGAGPEPAEAEARAQRAQLSEWVKAVHFCRTGSGNTAPKAFARHLAEQLTRTVPGFGAALVATLADQITITIKQEIGQVLGGSVTGVQIERLDLGALGDQLSFDRLLREPLEKLYAGGYTQTILLLVDALDESLTYTGNITLARLLTRLADLPQAVRLLVSTRPDPRVLKEYRSIKRLDLLKDAPTSVDDVRRYAEERLIALSPSAQTSLAERISQAAEGNFLYAHLVLNDLLARQASSSDLLALPLPQGLSGLYHDFLNRELGEDEDRWTDSFKPMLGLIAIAQGRGLSNTQLEDITGQNVEQPLRVCKQYLDGELPDGPFRPFHKSFADFLLTDPANSDYRIAAVEMHQQVADHYRQNYADNWADCDPYGLQYLATHMAEVVQGSRQVKQRHTYTERLVTIVLDPAFQQAHLAQLNDLSALRRDLERALKTAAADSHPDAPLLVVKAALGLLTLRRQQLQLDPLFKLARVGQIETAERHLALFAVEPEWRQAALLAIAWLAAATNPDAARALRDRIANDLPVIGPLPLLLARINMILDGVPLPTLDLPEPPSYPEALNIVAQLGGLPSDQNEPIVFEYAVSPNEAATHILADQGLVFVAERDGPLLVAYAAADPSEGDPLFQQYLQIQAANNYVHYRNRSLAFLLKAVLRHPNPTWVQDRLPEIIGAALSGSRMEFQEGLPLTILALQALAGQTEAGPALQARREQIQAEADNLRWERGRNDAWGSYQRRLAALTEAYALILDQPTEAANLLVQAMHVPHGFAGFQAPTSLTLAETARLCRPDDNVTPRQELRQAMGSAQNIQDMVLCVRTTARCRALEQRWWPSPATSFDVVAVAKRLAADPGLAEFASLHVVEDSFEYRRIGPEKAPLPPLVYTANTLADLAQVYQCSLADLQQLNANLIEPLPSETLVNLPDPDFAPLLAARFAAEILISPTLSASQRVQLIQLLVPIATRNPTALDTILSRLLLAAQPLDGEVLAELEAITSSNLKSTGVGS